MASKKIGFLVAVLVFLAPAAARADGIDFDLIGGTIAVGCGSPICLTNSGSSTLSVVQRLPNPPGPFSSGGPFGTVSVTTGTESSSTNTTLVFAAGGSVSVTSNGTPIVFKNSNGTTFGTFSTTNLESLFSGTFSGPTTATCTSGNFTTGCSFFDLGGPVSGNVDSALLAFLGLPNVTSGMLLQLNFGLNTSTNIWNISSGNLTLVPEPGTLALLGAGLLGLAGLVGRKIAP